jgi:methionine-rich copper-binding protein CopC
VIALIAPLTVVSAALAHVEPAYMDPAAGQQLTEPPDQVRILYREPVKGRYLRVYNERGERVDEGDATVGGPIEDPNIDIAHKAVYYVGLKHLPAGTYTVKNRITSPDGHTVGDTYEFAVLGEHEQKGSAMTKTTNDAPGEEQEPSRESQSGDPTLGSLLLGSVGLLAFLGILAVVGVRLGRHLRS